MKNILRQIKDSVYYNHIEDIGIKTKLINIFTVLFLLFRLPYYFYETNVILRDKIFVFGLVLILEIISFYLLYNKKEIIASYVSMIMVVTFSIIILFTDKSIISFLSLFITLTIILIYQKFRYFIIFGSIITAFGIYFILLFGANIYSNNADFNTIEKYIYIISISFVYIIYLLQMLMIKNENKKINLKYIELDYYIKKYQDASMYFYKKDLDTVFSNNSFINSVKEISLFLSEIITPESNMKEIILKYFSKEIVDDANVVTLLKKYNLDSRSNFISLIINFSTLINSDNKYYEDRYEISMNDICDNIEEQIISLIILYIYLRKESTKFDGEEIYLKHDEISEIFTDSSFTKYLTLDQIKFYKNNDKNIEKLFNKLST